jgi:DegV family protein with EDD domain
MKIKLITDSSSDLPLAFVKENNESLIVLGMPITINGEEHIDDLGETLSHDYFYEQLAKGCMPKTSQVNVTTFYDTFLTCYQEGYDILYIGLSSGLSGTYNSAKLAMEMLLEEAPSAKIIVVDSLAASIGLGAIIYEALRLIREGNTLIDIQNKVNSIKLHANHWFGVDDLMHLKNGGRIPAAIAVVGTVLNVKPILTMNLEGKLESYSTVRGKKKALKYLITKVVENLSSTETTIFVGHANDLEDADSLVAALREQGITNPVMETCLSATIASHVGPGMLAIAFIGGKIREIK